LFKYCKRDGHEIIKYIVEEDTPVKDRRIHKLTDLNTGMEGRKRNFIVKLIGLQELETYTKTGMYQCEKDYTKLKIEADEMKRLPKEVKCPECGKDMEPTRELETEFIREIFLQEGTGNTMSINPLVIRGRLYGQDAMDIELSADKLITARMHSEKIRGKNTNKIYLDIEFIKNEKKTDDQFKDLLELEKFKQFPRDKLIESFCPAIYKTDIIKEACLLSLIGGTKSGEMRGDINLFLIGDPSTGKTKLLTYASEMLAKSDYASGKSASGAGLVAGLDNLSDGTRFPRFGPVVYCDGGVVCIDELDKMSTNDRSMLHEAMSKQTVSLRKIGCQMTVPTRTTIIAAANPKASKYDSDATIRANINLPETLITRFAVIFLMLNDSDRETRKLIIQHVSRCRELGLNKVIEEDGLLTKNELKRFIGTARKLRPKVKGSLAEKLHTYFLDLESMEQEADSISLYVRGFEDLESLCEAQAKMRLSENVEQIDIDNGIRVHKKMLESLKFNTPHQMIEQNTLGKDDKFYILEQIIKNMKSPWTEDNIIQAMCITPKWKNKRVAALRDFDKMRLDLNLLYVNGVYKKNG